MNGDGLLTWRELVSDQCAKHSAALVDDLGPWLDSELNKARTEASADTEARVRAEEQSKADSLRTRSEDDKVQAIRDTRLAIAESLNQALRRIRKTASEAEALSVLLECTASCAQRAVVLRVENNQARSLGARGLEKSEFSFALDAAPAMANVHQNGEPVVSLISAGELSPELATAFSRDEASGKAYLFPISARQNVMAVLVAAGEVLPASLELLSESAGMKLESLHLEAKPALKPLPGPELVQIATPSVPETPASEHLKWTDLSAEDQKLHLQAQRVARVKVAEMRLYHAEELRKGVFDGKIYSALQPEIDLARADFLQNFLSKSRTMVDYLHLEILRSLAHEDDRLLGHEYPGPMV